MKPFDEFIELCKAHGLPIPEREYRFHPIRWWRIDYCWPEYKLAVEIEGGIWIYGRHNRAIGYKKDMEKYNQLAIQGYWKLQFTPQEITNGYAIDVIKTWFEGKGIICQR